MEMRHLFFVINIFTTACGTSKTSSTDIAHCDTTGSSSGQFNAQSTVNQNILKLLQFPKTILYIGATEPKTLASKRIVNKIPQGMVLVPAGKVHMGNTAGFAHELPQFWASVSAFYMDISPITVGQFRAFIKATGYKTEAEKFGNAGLITEDTDKQWTLVDGATWEYPLGKTKPKAPITHPVTQVSWNDATAYARWAGKRLPCEIEWEHAARNAVNTQTKFPWGDDIQENGKYKANVWQGKFPLNNLLTDTYAYTSPIGAFGKTPLGLTDMSGNVWEWMSHPKFDYASLFVKDTSDLKITSEYAQRGGSFLCEPTWCEGYRVSGRSSSSTETSLFHVGFRCVKDME